jgi:rare lipoprotein A
MQRLRTHVPAALLGIAVLLVSCGRKHHHVKTPHQPSPKPVAVPVGTAEQGLASWYGVPYHGRPAADGEIYDMETLVAAHRTLPFNTWLKVTNLNNNKSVNVRVIDRGPFVKNRIIDLSKAAARQILMLGPGVAQVRIEVISSPAYVSGNDFYAVQIGAFANSGAASQLRDRYAARYGFAKVDVKQGNTPLYRVLVGKFPTTEAAHDLAARLQPELGPVFVVRLDSGVHAASPAPSSLPLPSPGSSD